MGHPARGGPFTFTKGGQKMPNPLRVHNIETTQIFNKDLSRKWVDYKIQAKKIALALGVFGEYFERASKLRACGKRLIFGLYQSGNRKILTANFCRDPLCPTCSWRRSIKNTKKLEEYVDILKSQGYNFFLQLVPTIKSDHDIKGTMTKLKKAWAKLVQRKLYKKYFDGYYSQVEYTYSAEHGWHVHAHILVAVKKDLNFPLPAEEFAKMQNDFSELWLKITGDSFIFGVRSVKNLHEFCKYITKMESFKGADDMSKIVDLADEIKSRRLISKGGCFKKITISEVEGEFEIEQEEGDLLDPLVAIEIYTWNNKGNFYDKEVVTPEEFKKRSDIDHERNS